MVTYFVLRQYARTLVRKVRTWLDRACGWRICKLLSDGWHRLVVYWHTRDKGELVFFFALGLPLVVLGFVIYFFFGATNHGQELNCLALNVYHEARGEPTAGQYAVAEVTMNRVASRHYPNTVCKVVFQKKWDVLRGRNVAAFSWTEFDTRPPPNEPSWQHAREVAEAVYHQKHVPQLDGALHYHSKRIRPSWSRHKKPIARVGKHIFYK